MPVELLGQAGFFLPVEPREQNGPKTADGITSRRQITHNLSDIYATVSTVLGREDITRARPEKQDELICRALTRQRTLLIVDNLETIDDEQINAFLRELPVPTKAIIVDVER